MTEKGSRKSLRLLKGKRHLVNVIFSWTGIVLILLLLTVLLVLVVVNWLTRWAAEFAVVTVLVSLVVEFTLINSDMDSSGKITWSLLICLFPVFGPLLYLYFRLDFSSRMIRKATEAERRSVPLMMQQDAEILKELETESEEVCGTAKYLASTGTFPVFKGCAVKYYPLGEDKFEDLIEDLKTAEYFIFLEYFIIEEGQMWGEILEILAEKARRGVEVRVMYDGTCELTTLPRNYPERVRDLGIQCKMFSPLMPILSTHYNYRDHRKILVIDGRIAYNGGVNLADEYINVKKRFGHWKDSAVRVTGPAVQSYTLMFLEMWHLRDRSAANVVNYMRPCPPVEANGFVLPYADNPFDSDKAGETVYMDILYQARKYVHIMSPYLVLDDEMIAALRTTAKKGIDVSLILPGIPDKKLAYNLGKTYFHLLLEAGVKIYLYTPGFVHAKNFISDDEKAVVGTINLDYRSLYHHFECGTYMFRTDCIADIERDFQETLGKCIRVDKAFMDGISLWNRFVGWLARVIAPMM